MEKINKEKFIDVIISKTQNNEIAWFKTIDKFVFTKKIYTKYYCDFGLYNLKFYKNDRYFITIKKAMRNSMIYLDIEKDNEIYEKCDKLLQSILNSRMINSPFEIEDIADALNVNKSDLL